MSKSRMRRRAKRQAKRVIDHLEERYGNLAEVLPKRPKKPKANDNTTNLLSTSTANKSRSFPRKKKGDKHEK